jgi:hypothetical protein
MKIENVRLDRYGNVIIDIYDDESIQLTTDQATDLLLDIAQVLRRAKELRPLKIDVFFDEAFEGA